MFRFLVEHSYALFAYTWGDRGKGVRLSQQWPLLCHWACGWIQICTVIWLEPNFSRWWKSGWIWIARLVVCPSSQSTVVHAHQQRFDCCGWCTIFALVALCLWCMSIVNSRLVITFTAVEHYCFAYQRIVLFSDGRTCWTTCARVVRWHETISSWTQWQKGSLARILPVPWGKTC